MVGCVADLLTKHWIFQWLGMPWQHDNRWWIWEGYVGIETVLNRGALFGAGEGYSAWFAALSIAAAAGILLWLFRFGAAHDLLLTIALACVMAGICGNLYDRLGLWDNAGVPEKYQCAVRDWILLRYKQHSWPNFNIADCFLVCGAGLLMWQGFFRSEPRARCREPETDAPSAEQGRRRTMA